METATSGSGTGAAALFAMMSHPWSVRGLNAGLGSTACRVLLPSTTTTCGPCLHWGSLVWPPPVPRGRHLCASAQEAATVEDIPDSPQGGLALQATADTSQPHGFSHHRRRGARYTFERAAGTHGPVPRHAREASPRSCKYVDAAEEEVRQPAAERDSAPRLAAGSAANVHAESAEVRTPSPELQRRLCRLALHASEGQHVLRLKKNGCPTLVLASSECR
eukprot:gnl/TRDRNA2_/TRDRNA2_35804_c0_seq1.p1 gnl/TRDRNA2_/TRDRNA2_35804_c0~~gnl/TRDRNA2_/TRDRNA2_35804_c0_seq1.p1  ORF type:complete len:220 (+),score=27.30 gnl/TRDRNA2_/TRDRNA2_35804_c0_seq1:26-685(+)